jgi:ferredoxin
MEAEKSQLIPEIDLADCTDCGSCEAVCPEVFIRNETGDLEVDDLAEYPEDCVQEAVTICPVDCIHWETL